MTTPQQDEQTESALSHEKNGLPVDGSGNAPGYPPEKADLTSVDPALEKALLFKQDIHLVPFLALLYLLSFLDRIAIGNAKVAGMEHSLGLSGPEYAWSLSIFFIGYVLFEVPSNLLLKKLTPSKWIPSIMVVWGGIMVAMAFSRNFSDLMANRFFLGLAEAGLFPGVVYYLTFWYKRSEQSLRIALFFSAASLSGAFGGVLAYGIQQMDGIQGLAGWQWIFILEGGATVVLAFASYFVLADFPETAKFLTPAQRELAQRRLRNDTVATASHFSWNHVFAAARDIKVYFYMVIYIGILVPLYSFSLFIPSIVNGLGFTSLQAQLLSSPPYAVGCIATALVGYLSDRTGKRSVYLLICSAVGVLAFILLATLRSVAGLYTATFLAAIGFFPMIPTSLAWMTNNIGGSTKRGVASAMMISFGNIGGVLGGQIYRDEHKPHYIPGHVTNAAFLAVSFIFTVLLHLYLQRENRRRDQSERAHEGIDQRVLEDMGDLHPEFRYVL
ncbi:uncharacterized protein VTP21DRAFT_2610 [Calcarisporiella thermophila]|uniref:uncharacterized protein n=1 Tax=Calcarisporiella thermophila TaxID=911321 RepID=UPI0037447A98